MRLYCVVRCSIKTDETYEMAFEQQYHFWNLFELSEADGARSSQHQSQHQVDCGHDYSWKWNADMLDCNIPACEELAVRLHLSASADSAALPFLCLSAKELFRAELQCHSCIFMQLLVLSAMRTLCVCNDL